MTKDRGLYTDEHAKLNMANSVGKPYRPSNGSEGEMFSDRYCDDCKRDDGQPTCTVFEAKP